MGLPEIQPDTSKSKEQQTKKTSDELISTRGRKKKNAVTRRPMIFRTSFSPT